MKLPPLIALSGLAGAGKTSVAEFLVSDYGYQEVAFAYPMKRGLSEMFGIPIHYFESPVLKEMPIAWLGKSPRQLMQTLGSEWGRDLVAPDVWIRFAARVVESMHESGYRVVVSDVRYLTEADWVRRQEGSLWHLRRPEVRPGAHSSETGIAALPGEPVLNNGGTLDDLKRRAEEVLRAVSR